MECFFSRRINGNFGNSFENPHKAAGCALPKYLWNGSSNGYLVCNGDFRQCPVKDRYVSIALGNYWDSEERKNHQLLREQIAAENGRK